MSTAVAKEGKRRFAVWLAALGLLLGSTAAAPLAAQDFGASRPFNWAYAAAYGTGRYKIEDGGIVTVIRAPLHWTWRKPNSGHGCPCGIRILFPLTFGVENFDLQHLPERVDAVSFFPGIELVLPRTEKWTLKLTSQVGWGIREAESERETALLYGTGIRSRYVWPKARGRPALINGLYWSGFRAKKQKINALARFSSGLEFDVPVPRWKVKDETMHLMPHVLADWYFDPLEIEPIINNSSNKNVFLEWEIGLAAGRTERFSVFGVKFDRVGVAFRFSEYSRGIRLFFGSIF